MSASVYLRMFLSWRGFSPSQAKPQWMLTQSPWLTLSNGRTLLSNFTRFADGGAMRRRPSESLGTA